MNKQDILVKSAIASLLAFGSLALTTSAVAADKPKMEQCYGIAKAGKNDCAGGKGSANSCAGTAKKMGRKIPSCCCQRGLAPRSLAAYQAMHNTR